MHVQEYITQSGRKHLSQRRYDNIRSGLIELRVRVRSTINRDFTVYVPETDSFKMRDGISIETDNATHITICKNGKPMRRFTLVVSRKHNEPIPFGHLLKPQNPEMVRRVEM